MDWIKIKTKHVLFSPLNLSELGLFIKIQALTGHLERVPEEKEILSLPGAGRKLLASLLEKLRITLTSMPEVQRKVLEDVSEVVRNRDTAKDRMAELRSKNKNVTPNIPVTFAERSPTDKIREDKSIKEEKEKEKEIEKEPLSVLEFNDDFIKSPDTQTFREGKPYRERVINIVWNYWRKDIRGTFFDFCKTFGCLEDLRASSNIDLYEFMNAFAEYVRSDKVKEGICLRIDKWAKEWRNYIPDDLVFPEDFSKDLSEFESEFK